MPCPFILVQILRGFGGSAPNVVELTHEKKPQLIRRLSPPHIRNTLECFRLREISAAEAATELSVSRSRIYTLYSDYLRAFARGCHATWEPGRSGGDHKPAWPEEVMDLIRRRLSSKPPSPYSFIASEAMRLYGFRLDRAQVRRWAIRHGLAHPAPPRRPRAPIRRWQRQRLGELWQLDATPHAWFPDNPTLYPMLNMLDDCSRLFVASRIYDRENVLAYMDLIPRAFLQYGVPLALYVDWHSIFYTQRRDNLTELGKALHFYGVSFRYASTPQAKGKIEREHQYWQKRLPAYFAAEKPDDLFTANEAITSLRLHRNEYEVHSELDMTAQVAWDQAIRENRSVMRQAKPDAWWPYVWSRKRRIRVGDDGRVPIGNTTIRIEAPPRTSIVHCLHPDGTESILKQMPDPSCLPVVLFSNRPT